jgi:two-component system KDP operon response regulator KdpE
MLGKCDGRARETRVLAVDDESQILRFLRRSLEGRVQAIITSDPSEVTRLVELEEPDLILLDLMLPGTTGFELMARIREFSGVPVIFLTASDREEDAVRALREGADDYITKPFSPSELLARIAAALRRRVLPDVMEARPVFSLGDLTIDFTERRVTVAGQEVSLSATEYKILHQMATHAGRPLSYEHLLRQVWGPEYSQETELVRSFIRNLRQKLGDAPRIAISSARSDTASQAQGVEVEQGLNLGLLRFRGVNREHATPATDLLRLPLPAGVSEAAPEKRMSTRWAGERNRTSSARSTSPICRATASPRRSARTSTTPSGLAKEPTALSSRRTSSWMGSHGFSPVNSIAGARGRMESPRTNRGMRSSGTVTTLCAGPSSRWLVQKSYQDPAGR